MIMLYKVIRYLSRLLIELIRLILLVVVIGIRALKSEKQGGASTKSRKMIGIAEYPHAARGNSMPGGDASVHDELTEILTRSGYTVEKIIFDTNLISTNRFMEWVVGVPYTCSTYLKNVSEQYDIIVCDSGIVWDLSGDKYVNLFHFSYIEYLRRVSRLYDPLALVSGLINGIIQVYGSKRTYNIAVSEYLKSKLEHVGIVIDRVIPNGINTQVFKPSTKASKKKGVLYIGGFSFLGKGFDIIKTLGTLGVKISCITNHEENSWKNVDFFPPVPHIQTPKVYNNYAVTVYPSRFESCQMVPLESMACGTPVVISNVGIGPELLKIIPEFVVTGYDNEAIMLYKKRISEILDNYDQYSKLARDYVINNFDINQFEKKWVEVIKGKYENTI